MNTTWEPDDLTDFERLALEAETPLDDDVRGANIRAAVAILADGKPRSADELLAAAVAQGLLAANVTRKHLYIALTQYIARTKGVGRVPLIVQDPDRRFRANHPADDWPEPREPLAARPAPPDTAALAARLRATSTGAEPDAFERAVCDAFAALGFVARHIGGHEAPDGTLDAPLGPLGYRVMLECKTARGGKVTDPDAAEAAKFRDDYHADHAILIGPGYGADTQLQSELDVHEVSAWTVDDLIAVLGIAANPAEIRPLLAPGFAEDRVADALWERTHGRAKRIAVIAETIAAAGWDAQLGAAGDKANAPRLTEDAAMLLVDTRLRATGAHVECSRDDVRAAFAYLTSPLVAKAIWLSTDTTAIVITTPPSHAAREPGASRGGDEKDALTDQ